MFNDKNTDTEEVVRKLLTDHYFKVKIPYVRTRSEQDIRSWGVPVSGIKSIDNNIHNSLTETFLPIYKLLEFFKQHVPIRVVIYSDTKIMYDYITRFIVYWKNKLETSLSVGLVPVDELIELDRFANVVYDQAKYQFTTDIANGYLNRMLGDKSNDIFGEVPNNYTPKNKKISDNGVIIDNSRTRAVSPERETLNIGERDAFGDFFKEKLSYLHRR